MAERPKDRATTLQAKLGFADSELATAEHDAIVADLDLNMKSVLRGLFPYITGCTGTTEKTWEYPIGKDTYGRGNPFIVGFIDIHVVVRFESTPPGYPSMLCVNFEVKSHIKSAGEVIRQIRLYEQYVPAYEMFVVVSPDTQFREVLRNQKIGFVAYTKKVAA